MAKTKMVKVEGSIKNPYKPMSKAEFDRLQKSGTKSADKKKKKSGK